LILQIFDDQFFRNKTCLLGGVYSLSIITFRSPPHVRIKSLEWSYQEKKLLKSDPQKKQEEVTRIEVWIIGQITMVHTK
jgi:hypothetical protein